MIAYLDTSVLLRLVLDEKKKRIALEPYARLIWKERNQKALTLLTHDAQLGRVARAVDIPVVGDAPAFL